MVRKAIIAILLSLPALPASAAIKNYCNELEANPNLSANNPRVYESPYKPSCETGYTLPGFGSIPGLNERLCSQIERSTRRYTQEAIRSVRDRVAREVDNATGTVSDELRRIHDGTVEDVRDLGDSGLVDQIFGEGVGDAVRGTGEFIEDGRRGRVGLPDAAGDFLRENAPNNPTVPTPGTILPPEDGPPASFFQ